MKNLSPLLVAVLLFGCTSTVQPTAGQAVSKVVAAAVQKKLDISPVAECAIRAALLTPIAIAAQYGIKNFYQQKKKAEEIGRRALQGQRERTPEEETEIRDIQHKALKVSLLGLVGIAGYWGCSLFIDAQFDHTTWSQWWLRVLAGFPSQGLRGCLNDLLKQVPATAKLGPWSKSIGFNVAGATLTDYVQRRYVDPRFGAVRPVSGKEKILRITQRAIPYAIAEALFEIETD